MTFEQATRYLLNGLAWAILGVVIEQLRARRAARHKLVAESRLDRFTYGLVILMTFAGVAFSVSTRLAGDATANCVNDVLGERNGASASDSEAQLAFAENLLRAYTGAVDRTTFEAQVKAYRDTLQSNKDFRAANPLGRC